MKLSLCERSLNFIETSQLHVLNFSSNPRTLKGPFEPTKVTGNIDWPVVDRLRECADANCDRTELFCLSGSEGEPREASNNRYCEDDDDWPSYFHGTLLLRCGAYPAGKRAFFTFFAPLRVAFVKPTDVVKSAPSTSAPSNKAELTSVCSNTTLLREAFLNMA